MKNLKKLLAIFLSIAMVMCSTLPSLASETETTVGASEETVVDETEEGVGAKHDELAEETESTEETVGASSTSPEEETESDVGASTASPEEETESTVGDDILSSHDEESEPTESEEGSASIHPYDEQGEGEPAESEPAESETTESETAESETAESESTVGDDILSSHDETSELLSELKATKSEIVSEEKLLGATSTPWMYYYIENGNTIRFTNTNKSGATGVTADTGDDITYSGLGKSDITKAIFDTQINAVTCASFFNEFINLEKIDNLEYLITEDVEDMAYMFRNCDKLESLNLSNFKTLKVKSMEEMFWSCDSLTVLDLSSFNTANLTNMNGIFANCYSLETIIVSDNFVTSSISNGNFFKFSTKLVGGNGTAYDESKIDKDYARIDEPGNPGYFSKAPWIYWYLTDNDTIIHYTKNKPASGENGLTRRDIVLYKGLENHNIDKAIFDDEIDAATCKLFFSAFVSLKDIIDLDKLKVSQVTSMEKMFYDCRKLKVLDLSSFNTSNVVNMKAMFRGCSILTTIIVSSSFDITKVSGDGGNQVFMNCWSLRGCNNTGYVDPNMDINYARLDGGSSAPGYFSSAPWMYWYLSDSDETIHYTNTKPTSGDYEIVTRLDRVIYNGLEDTKRENITKAKFDDNITAMTCGHFFSFFKGLASIENLEKLDTTNVTNMQSMFEGCEKIESLELSNWTTGSLTDMGAMFRNCSSLTLLNVSNFNTSKVLAMVAMFENCSSLKELDLTSFNTSSVHDMQLMFYNCSSLKTIYASNSFVTTSVVGSHDQYMFTGCTSLEGSKGTRYDASHVGKEYAHIDGGSASPGYFHTNDWMWWKYDDVSKVLYLYGGDQIGYDGVVSGLGPIEYSGLPRDSVEKVEFETDISVRTCEGMFDSFTELKEIVDIKYYLNTSSVMSMESMFYGCEKLTDLDVTKFDTSNVTNMSYMFSGCRGLTNLDVTKFDTSSVTNMSNMFLDCSSLLDLDLSKFITDNVEDMSEMFAGCSSLTELDLKSFKVNNVENMSSMFSRCSELTKLDITNFTSNKVKNFRGFLESCSKLEDIDLSGLDTSSAVNMGLMFYKCGKLQVLDLSSFNTTSVKDMMRMFRDCSSLEKIIVSNKFSVDNVTIGVQDYGYNMFFGCTNLVGGAGTTYDGGHTDKEYARIDGGSSSPGYFSNLPWAYWQLSDGNKTIHYTYAKPASGDYETMTRTDQVVYDNLTKQDITKAVFEEDINPVTCEGFFESFTNLKTIEGLEKLRTVDVKNMKRMFFECSELEKLDLKHFNTSNVELMEQMFSGCNKLVTITVADHLVTTSVTDDGVGMFENCTSLVGGNGTKFDASHINYEYARADKKSTPGYFTGTIFKSISINTKPQTIVYNVGDTLDPSGLKINLHYSDNSTEVEEYNSQTEADFTFRPSLGTALALTDRIVTVTYDGKSTTFTIEVKQSGGGGVTPKPGGNTGGSSSGGSGGGGPTIAEDVPGITYLNATSAILGVFASSSSNWSYDPVDNSWQLNSIDANGNAVRAINGLYALTQVRTHIVNGVSIETIVPSVYCLNANAKMVTGWVKTLDGKWFFFENKKNADEGKMVTGWKQIQGAWYYFGEDGAMYIDTVAPDGRRVGAT